MANELGIGLSPITEKIYLGKQNKAKRMWVGDKKDITDNFIDVVFEYIAVDEVREIEVESGDAKTTVKHFFVHCINDKKSLEKSIEFLQKELSNI